MSMWQKRAVLSLVIWSIATIGFLAAGFAGDGPSTLVQDTPRRNTAAAFVAAGLGLTFVVRYLTRSRADVPGGIVDERDRAINLKSSELALGVTVAGVFVACIVLADAFEAAGSVPVPWLWFVAFSTLVVAHITQAAAAVALYAGGSRGAEG